MTYSSTETQKTQNPCYGKFIKPLVWDDEPKEKHAYKCVSVAYVSLPVQGDWKSHIAICDEGDYGFKATVWLMNGGFEIAKYCSTIEDAKTEVAKWWTDFVGCFLNCQYVVSGMLPTDEEIINEAEGRYPVKTHNFPDNSPYVGTQKTFIHGVRWALAFVQGNYR